MTNLCKPIFEHPSRHGRPLAYSTKSEVTLQQPDRLLVLIAGDGPASEFYYDGKNDDGLRVSGKLGCRSQCATHG